MKLKVALFNNPSKIRMQDLYFINGFKSEDHFTNTTNKTSRQIFSTRLLHKINVNVLVLITFMFNCDPTL